MTKKNLSDLLREETQPAEAKSQATPAPAKQTPPRRSTSRRGPTKADLEAQVKALTASLDTAKAQEAKLLDQVKDLQTDLETQQSRLFELKDTLEATEKSTQQKEAQLSKLVAELEAAKQVILKMSQPPTPEVKPEPKPEPKLERVSERTPLAIKMSRRAPAKQIPEYAIQRGEQRSMVSDMDIGWFD